jgi:hypothetical protein
MTRVIRVSCLFLGFCVASCSNSALPLTFTKQFEGTMKESREQRTSTLTVRMTLTRSESKLFGATFYPNVEDGGVHYNIEGSMDGRSIRFSETPDGGSAIPWRGRFVSDTEIEAETSGVGWAATMTLAEVSGYRASWTGPSAPASVAVSLDDQAIAESRKAYEAKHTRCGDSYYTDEDGSIFEERGVGFSIDRADRVTEADQLNGIQWKGTVHISCQARRKYWTGPTNTHRWSDWENCALPYTVLQKKNGEWTVVRMDLEAISIMVL